MLQPGTAERTGAPDDAMDGVAFFQKKFREIGTVLSRDAGNEGFLAHEQMGMKIMGLMEMGAGSYVAKPPGDKRNVVGRDCGCG
jgi:hypothetical protein